MNKTNFKDSPTTILDFSKRTVSKILNRGNVGCSICGWNKSTCDIHHIEERANGGSDETSNLIIICPNCHRCVHNLGDSFISLSELKDKCIEKTFSNWSEFYNIRRKIKFNINGVCPQCGGNVEKYGAKYCSDKCLIEVKYRFDWESIDLESLLLEFNFNLSKLSKHINISDNAIRKHCKRNNIEYRKLKEEKQQTQPRIKLTDIDILEIREIFHGKSKGERKGIRAIAKRYNVHHTTIINILDNKSHKSL